MSFFFGFGPVCEFLGFAKMCDQKKRPKKFFSVCPRELPTVCPRERREVKIYIFCGLFAASYADEHGWAESGGTKSW